MRTPDHTPPELAALAALADAVKLLVTAARAQHPPYGSLHRLVFVVDIMGYNDQRHDDEIQLALRRSLYLVLTRAFEAAAVPWPECVHEDRGDGVLVIIPSRVPAAAVIGPLLSHLHAGVRRHNRLSSEVAQFRLRVSMHAGVVHHDEYGLAGTAVNHAFRLLEAPTFKEAAARNTGAIAVVVSNDLYDAVVRHAPGLISPESYQPIIAMLKETRAPAWIHLPGEEPNTGADDATTLASGQETYSA